MKTEKNGEPDRSVVYIMPHQDDEFAVIPWMEADIRDGVRVYCVFLTHGGTKARLRNGESTRVLCKLGVRQRRVWFMGDTYGWRDGSLISVVENIVELVDVILRRVNPESIYVPAWEGGHPDHDVVCAASWVASRRAAHDVLVYEYPVYNGYRTVYPNFNIIALVGTHGKVVRRIVTRSEISKILRQCVSYKSQWKSWIGLWPKLACALLMRPVFVCRLLDEEHVRSRPHEGTLYYEYRNFAKYEEVRLATFRVLVEAVKTD